MDLPAVWNRKQRELSRAGESKDNDQSPRHARARSSLSSLHRPLPATGSRPRLFDPNSDHPIRPRRDRSPSVATAPTRPAKHGRALVPAERGQRAGHREEMGSPAARDARATARGRKGPPAGRTSWRMMPEPKTRPISQDKLMTEVKTIYAGLVILEAKCVEVVSKQVADAKTSAAAAASTTRPPAPPLNDEQWRALVALHRNLLYDHHDFFLASQHPSAEESIKRLAQRYAMPARMWRHGIHSFLELLRHRLPDSLEHMLTFLYLAYSMMALLYDTVPKFEDTWVECLGDLGRYRMAIEDDDLHDRDTWTNVARFWYRKAADKDPTVGRRYHHLAILAQPHLLPQLANYGRSLTCVQPFLGARESVLNLFEPLLKAPAPSAHHRPRPPSMEEHLVRAHGMLFTGTRLGDVQSVIRHYLASLDQLLDRATGRWKEQGVLLLVANAAALFEYGSTDARLKLVFDQSKMQEDVDAYDEAAPAGISSARPAIQPDFRSSVQLAVHLPSDHSSGIPMDPDTATEPTERERAVRRHAPQLVFRTLELSLRRIGDAHIMPSVHVGLVLLWSMATVPGALDPLEAEVPWEELANYLNAIARPKHFRSGRLLKESFPKNPDERPLREDYAIVGQIWTERYFPDGWFPQTVVDDEARELELPSMAEPRLERVLWLSVRLASVRDRLIPVFPPFSSLSLWCADHGLSVQLDRWLSFDAATARFTVIPEFRRSRPRSWATTYVLSSSDLASLPDTDDDEMREDDAGEDGDVEMSGPEDAGADLFSPDGSRGSERVVTPAPSVTDG